MSFRTVCLALASFAAIAAALPVDQVVPEQELSQKWDAGPFGITQHEDDLALKDDAEEADEDKKNTFSEVSDMGGKDASKDADATQADIQKSEKEDRAEKAMWESKAPELTKLETIRTMIATFGANDTDPSTTPEVSYGEELKVEEAKEHAAEEKKKAELKARDEKREKEMQKYEKENEKSLAKMFGMDENEAAHIHDVSAKTVAAAKGPAVAPDLVPAPAPAPKAGTAGAKKVGKGDAKSNIRCDEATGNANGNC